MGAVATATSWLVVSSGSRRKPRVSATMCTDWMKPAPRTFSMMLPAASSGVAPKSITWRTTSGAP